MLQEHTDSNSYIEGLDGEYIYALAETALHHQIVALREAIVAHLRYETRFRFSPPVCIELPQS